MGNTLQNILGQAGITINGNQPYDIHVHDERFYKRVLVNASIGAGESYMEGWWSCKQLDELFFRITRHVNTDDACQSWQTYLTRLMSILINHQTRRRSRKVAKQHYNLDNNLYRHMLGKSMAYTCAYWQNAQMLDQAQHDKFDLVCKKSRS